MLKVCMNLLAVAIQDLGYTKFQESSVVDGHTREHFPELMGL